MRVPLRPAHRKVQRRKGEEGGLLILLMVGVAIVSIALGAATQAWSTTWRRDNEKELIFRGTQYVDAILAYRKEHAGQFPTRLEQLFELGPRQLRYIRKLYRDPIAKDGRWGLLYLAPNGQGIYDPGAAQRQQELLERESDSWIDTPSSGAVMPGFTPLNTDPTGTGVPSPAAGFGGTGRTVPIVAPPIPPPTTGDPLDDDSVSEPAIGWAIIGVVSRASGKRASNTFKIYRGHQQINEWQFHVFDRGVQLQLQTPAGAKGAKGSPFIGPGFGGKGRVGGIGDGTLPGMRRGQRRLFPGGAPGRRKDDPGQSPFTRGKSR